VILNVIYSITLIRENVEFEKSILRLFTDTVFLLEKKKRSNEIKDLFSVYTCYQQSAKSIT